MTTNTDEIHFNFSTDIHSGNFKNPIPNNTNIPSKITRIFFDAIGDGVHAKRFIKEINLLNGLNIKESKVLFDFYSKNVPVYGTINIISLNFGRVQLEFEERPSTNEVGFSPKYLCKLKDSHKKIALLNELLQNLHQEVDLISVYDILADSIKYNYYK